MRRGERGAAAVEFAIVLPLLFLVLFGVVEFSLLMYDRTQIASASRELARFATVFTPCDPSSELSPCDPDVNASIRRSEAEIQQYRLDVYDRADDGNLDFGDLGMTTLGNSDLQVTVISTCPNICDAGDCFGEVGLSFTHDYLLFVPFSRALFPGATWDEIVMRARTRMRCE